jgi:hypothetical protein
MRLQKKQTSGYYRSIELAIIAPRRSGRDIFHEKTAKSRKTKNRQTCGISKTTVRSRVEWPVLNRPQMAGFEVITEGGL